MRLIRFVCYTLLLFSCVSCQKEFSEENGIVSTAVGTIKTTGGNCLPSFIGGIFKEGTALNPVTNFIDVEVNVSTTGSYIIKSNTLDGFSFEGSGRFTNAGLQVVRLKATGTPSSDGTYPFEITFGSSTCIINVVVADAATPDGDYTFDTGSMGECSGAVTSGVFMAGTPLGLSSAVSLNVLVTTAGTYSLTIPATNGISFSGSGIFNSTGLQAIVLTASGTPSNPGLTNYSAVFGASNCTFTVGVIPAGNNTTAVYTLGGTGNNCTGFTLSGTYMAGLAMNGSNTAAIDVNVTTTGTYLISSVAMNGVTFTASGTFTSTGIQAVVLNAAGTPSAPGAITYNIAGNSGSCAMPVTFLPQAPPAVFTLSGAPGNCTSAIVSGGYVATIPMTNSNTVTIKVDVTTAGLYTISTATVNGITFSGNGLFTTTGNGIDVVLTASGTPTAAGVFSYAPLSGTSSCTFDITTSPAPTGIYTCKIDGVFYAFYDRAAADIDDSGSPYLYLNGYTAPPNGNSIPQLEVFITNNNSAPVAVGSYNVDGIITPGYRIEIDYHAVNPDGSVTIWNTSSSILSPNPPFTINVTSVTATRVRGTFSGKITNILQGSTSQKTISEGVFDLPVQ